MKQREREREEREKSAQSSLINGSSIGVVVGFLAKQANTLLSHIIFISLKLILMK
jgi:hypothetical protein